MGRRVDARLLLDIGAIEPVVVDRDVPTSAGPEVSPVIDWAVALVPEIEGYLRRRWTDRVGRGDRGLLPRRRYRPVP